MPTREETDGTPLTTERLELVPFTEDHLDVLHEMWIDADVRRYLWDDRIISRQDVVEVVVDSSVSFAREGFGFWLLLLREGGEPVGFAGLRHFGDAGEIEILYGLFPTAWHRGLATEASQRVLRYAFEDLGLSEVFAGADPPNARSFRVMERLGLEPCGRRVIHGVETDYYSATRDGFLGGQPPSGDDRHAAVEQIRDLRTHLRTRYGEMPDSTELIREDRAR
jgi:RimJ/RimL family protein N-acetyltransferase